MSRLAAKRVKRRFFTALLACSALLLVAVCLRLSPHATFQSQLPQSQQVLAADNSLLRLTLASDQQYRIWTQLSDIAPVMVEAILLKEDRYFWWHPGVNPVALLRATRDAALGTDHRGASTITMQLARRWYQLNTRSASGKLKQIFYALWLELRYSKREILEAYLNIAPMGGNIEGIGAGSLVYFNKPPRQLSLVESLALAVLPQDPVRRSDFGDPLQTARKQLAMQWRNTHAVDAQATALLDLAVHGRARRALPFLAPHLAEQLLANKLFATNKQDAVIHTTIQPALQRLLETLLQAYVRENGNRNIHNATALLVDTRDMSVQALVGSADYFDASIAGQVNGVRAKRSPGSTLKPFLYGLAIDQGLIHPQSILKDAPTAFGPFQPENFDGVFVGPIHAQDALVRSRNIPAVALAMQLHNPSLYGFLKHAGVAKLLPENHYGLALTLGGGEVTMEELVSLYSLLANRGELHALRYTQDQPLTAGTALLSPEAAFLVIDMLQKNPRPDTTTNMTTGTAQRHWHTAWKTGTSWGFRDAWTAGLVGHYALAVWIGNFDGRSNPAFVGIDAAAPLFFRIADALPLSLPQDSDRANTPPKTLKRIAVCEASGDLPNSWCPKTVDTWFIPGKSPIRVSTLHRPVVIDTRTGTVACPPYDTANTRTEIYEFWSSEIFQQFTLAGIPRRQPPTSDCLNGNAGDERDYPVINQPLAGVTYTLRLARDEETIPLQVRVAADVQHVFWFADAVFIGTAKPQESLAWRPQTAGHYSVTAVDDHGRSVSRPLAVEFVP